MTLRNGFMLGSWTIYPLEGRLESDGVERRVQPKSMDVLLLLAEAAGEVREREFLLQQIWGDRAPTDEPLTRCIGELRRALGDSRSESEYILTVPKRGYRLLKLALPLDRQRDKKADVPADAVRSRLGRRHTGLALLLLAILTVPVAVNRFSEQPVGPGPGTSSPDGNAIVASEPSIVVLPFLNLSPDAEQEYFSDGITEELLTLLARFPGLKVISRSSAFSYKGSTADARTVAGELNVSHVLEGSVRRSGDDVRVSVRLIDADSNTQLWSETYERTMGDIFAAQDAIATNVAEALELRLLADGPTMREHNPEAFALVLQARYVGRQFTPEAFEKSITLLERALELDSAYAAAWDELSRIYRRQAGQGLRPVDEAYAQSRNAANRALALDPELASAHRSLAVIARNYDRDLFAAADHIQRAFYADRTDAANISNAAAMAAALGRLNQAIALQEFAVARDPVNPVINTFMGTLHLHAGNLDDAAAAYRATLILNPGYIGAHFLLSVSLLLNGDLEGALEAIQQEADEGYGLIGKVMIHHALNDNSASDAALAELISKYERDAPYNIAYTLAYRGQTDRAFEWLGKAVDYKDPGLTDVVTDPLFVNIHGDPRWLAFLESIDKAPAQLSAVEFNVTLPE